MNSLQLIQNDIASWSDKTFGTDKLRHIGMASHLVEESNELKRALKIIEYNKLNGYSREEIQLRKDAALMELADCFILLLDIARKLGWSVIDILPAIRRKMLINKARKWGKSNSDGSVNHIKNETS